MRFTRYFALSAAEASHEKRWGSRAGDELLEVVERRERRSGGYAPGGYWMQDYDVVLSDASTARVRYWPNQGPMTHVLRRT